MESASSCYNREKGDAMKILILENDEKEKTALVHTLEHRGHTVVSADSSGQLWNTLQQEDGFEFLIINKDRMEAGDTQLFNRIRTAYPSTLIYILLITVNVSEQEKDADDILYRPYTDSDLKNRISVAERFISLTNKMVALQRKIENQEAFDGLTGFMNRPAFLRQSAGELERSRRASHSMSVVALDIDNFTIINDRFGKKIGHDVLQVAAESIRDKSRPYDCIGRWAGDEFVLALPGVIGADAEKVALRIMAGIVDTRIEVPNEEPLNVQASAGIASLMRITANTEIEPLILSAREALARAKQQGGNQVYTNYL